ncbi:helix-turn-helix domain-containing protein [Paraburkholderia terrae]
MERISSPLDEPNEIGKPRSEVADGCSPCEHEAIEAARALMLSTLRYGLSIEAVASSVQMSKRHFLRLFKRATGTTPHNWRLGEKVRCSQLDLLNGDLSLTQIAHRYGFADHAHYTRVFRQIVGTCPSAWRSQAARGSAPTWIARFEVLELLAEYQDSNPEV